MANSNHKRFRCPTHWTARQRIDHYTVVDQQTGCHIFTGYVGKNGYGVLTIGCKTRAVHRLEWELTNGPIPSGLHVLHNCPGGDNRRCHNPAHLWLGTNEQNIADMIAKGRNSRGERHSVYTPRGSQHGNAKLTEDQARSIYAAHGNHDDIARTFGVSPSVVGAIKRKVTWRHVHSSHQEAAFNADRKS